MPDQGDHRLVVELGVVQAVEQVDRARPAGHQRAAQRTAAVLDVGGGGETGGLLVPDLDELGPPVGALQRGGHAVDAVAGIAEVAVHAPAGQPGHDVVRDGGLW